MFCLNLHINLKAFVIYFFFFVVACSLFAVFTFVFFFSILFIFSYVQRPYLVRRSFVLNKFFRLTFLLSVSHSLVLLVFFFSRVFCFVFFVTNKNEKFSDRKRGGKWFFFWTHNEFWIVYVTRWPSNKR